MPQRTTPDFDLIAITPDELAGPLGEGFFELYKETFHPSVQIPRDVIVSGHARGERRILVAVRKGRVIALATLLQLLDGRALLLEYLAVMRELRSQGIGSYMLQEMAASNAADGSLGMAIECDHPDHVPDNERTACVARIAFYERNGAGVIERLPVYWGPDLSDDGGREAMRLLWHPRESIALLDDATLRQAVREIYVDGWGIEDARADDLLAASFEA